MPKLSVWMVRAALFQMGIGFLLGSLVLHHKGIPIYPWTWRLLPPHIEIMIFGWVMQFVMGMAYWILPRFSGVWRYGDLRWGWSSFITLNFGIALGALGGWWSDSVIQVIGRLQVLCAVLFFIVSIWARVKPLAFAPKTTMTGEVVP